jgi:general secretion pathway protein A
MLSGIKDRRGIIVITGEAGVGKTLLVYALLKDRSEKIRTAFIFNPTLDLRSILENVFQELGLPLHEKGENLFSLLVRFRKTLKESLTQSETVAIVIDEAQSLEEEALEGLFRLATPDSPGINALQILLVGHPDLEVKLNAERFNPFKERIAVKGRINPLTREEGRDYISYRLNLVGRNIAEVFTPEGVNKILEFSKGNPRVINLLCSRALSTGRQASSPIVDSKIVNKAIKELKYLRVRKPKTSSPLAYLQKEPWSRIIKILFFIFSTAVFFLSLNEIISRLLK